MMGVRQTLLLQCHLASYLQVLPASIFQKRLSTFSVLHNQSTNWPGHEDGKVKVWLSRQNSLRLLTALDTARYFLLSSTSQGIGITPFTSRYFVAEDTDDRSDTMDEWPPFRRVGSFDPFSDDPR